VTEANAELMTLTETRPELAPAAQLVPPPAPEPDGLAAYLGTGDHKKIGRLYIAFSMLYLLVSLGASAVLAFEQSDQSGLDVFTSGSYFQVLSLASQGLVFLGLLPLLLGLAILVTPLQVGSRTIAFPRAAAASFWGYLVGGGMLIGAYGINGGPGGGDTQAVDLWILSFGIVIASLLIGTVCVVTTVITLRTPGMYLDRVPLFSWSMVVAGSLWIFTLPVVLASLLLAYLDHRYGRMGLGGNYDLYPWIHWTTRPPQVFLYAIPAIGIVAELIPVAAGARQRLYKTVMALIALTGALAFGAYTVLLYRDLGTEVVTLPIVGSDFSIYSNYYLVIAMVTLPLPILLLLGAWTDTLVRGTNRRFDAGLLFALATGLLLLLGTATAALSMYEPLDLAQTSWLAGVASLAIGAGLVGGLGGCYWWATKIWGITLPAALAMAVVVAALAGSLLVGGGQLAAGAAEQPDVILLAANGGEVPYAGVLEVDTLVDTGNLVSTVGWALLGLSVLLMGLGVIGAAVRRPSGDDEGSAEDVVPNDPWDGFTLEWATQSPPITGNFTDVALVTSAAPLLDEREARGGND
jgi:heme/copper-type cytochrome/quinol oxidase subunit 1